MRRLFILKVFKVAVLHLLFSSVGLLFANIQLENKSQRFVNIESGKSNLEKFEEFKRQREQRFRELRDHDINERRAVIHKQSLPNSLRVKKKGQAVFVSTELIQANTGSIQHLLRGLKLSPHKSIDGSTTGYTIRKLKRGCFASELGFKVGDVIHRINNFEILSMSSIYKAYRRILKKSPEKIVVVYSSEKGFSNKQVITFFKVDSKTN